MNTLVQFECCFHFRWQLEALTEGEMEQEITYAVLTLSLVDPPYGGIGTYRNKKNIKKLPFILEERFTYQNVKKELLYKHAKNCCYSTMVTVMSNSGVGVSKIILRENGERLTCIQYFWLSSSRSEMEGSEKIYFTTEKPII